MTTSAAPRGAVLAPAGASGRDTSGLEAIAVPLTEAHGALARQLARRHGRLLERDGLTLAGLGLAARLELPCGLAAPGAAGEAAGLLAALGPKAVALGALPFDGTHPGHLDVPEITVRLGPGPSGPGDHDPEDGRRGGALAVVVADPERAAELARGLAGPDAPQCLEQVARGPRGSDGSGKSGGPSGSGGSALTDAPAGEPPDVFTLTSRRPHAHFLQLVDEAVAAIGAGKGGLEKVVLAREVEIVANRPFRQDDLVERLRALHPSCATFAVDGFVGASPELLCARRGEQVRAVPLAGTVARSGDPDEDTRLAAALLASEKDRAEHALVVRSILDELAPLCRAVTAAAEPSVLELRNVAHLATTITGTLAGAPSALELAAALHPTPAVGGWPKGAALEYLAAHEDLERDRFAGPVGYLEGTGDGEWWLGIRSALVEGSRARILAGVGIVAGSDPRAELAETQLKLQALLAVAVRP